MRPPPQYLVCSTTSSASDVIIFQTTQTLFGMFNDFFKKAKQLLNSLIIFLFHLLCNVSKCFVKPTTALVSFQFCFNSSSSSCPQRHPHETIKEAVCCFQSWPHSAWLTSLHTPWRRKALLVGMNSLLGLPILFIALKGHGDWYTRGLHFCSAFLKGSQTVYA